VVVVQESSPLVALTATSPVSVNGIVTFSVTITQNPGNVPVESVLFTFGDGEARQVQGLSTTYSYSSPGTYVASATVRFTNGRTSQNTAQVRVN
jgi:PKD repeat protein